MSCLRFGWCQRAAEAHHKCIQESPECQKSDSALQEESSRMDDVPTPLLSEETGTRSSVMLHNVEITRTAEKSKMSSHSEMDYSALF